MLRNGHAGFGERPGETGQEQSGYRAPGRLNRAAVLGARMDLTALPPAIQIWAFWNQLPFGEAHTAAVLHGQGL